MIQLQALDEHHADAIQALLADEDVLGMTRLPQPYPEDGASGFLQYLQPRMAAGEEFAFAIISDGVVAGMCGLVFENGTAQIGYWLGKRFWRQGIATQAVAQLLDFCFQARGLAYIEAQTLARNTGSCRLLEKLGFTLQRQEANTFPKWSGDEVISIYGLQAPAPSSD